MTSRNYTNKQTNVPKTPAKRGRKRKVLVNEVNVDVDDPSQENQEPEVAPKLPAKKRGRKKKEDTIPLASINENSNIDPNDNDINEIQDQAAAENIPANKQSQRTKHVSTTIRELLEISDDNFSPGNFSFKIVVMTYNSVL